MWTRPPPSFFVFDSQLPSGDQQEACRRRLEVFFLLLGGGGGGARKAEVGWVGCLPPKYLDETYICT